METKATSHALKTPRGGTRLVFPPRSCNTLRWNPPVTFIQTLLFHLFLAPTSNLSTMSEPWYKKPKYCLCEDGFKHEGRMELVTWDTPAGPYNSEALGWGATAEDSEGLKRKFEEEFGGDEEKLFDYFPPAFRWTCCGLPGDSLFGCDHHGKDGRVCTCDF